MATLEFVKMHGCGNDYVYVVANRVRPADPAGLARRLADRRFGVGGDGLIMLTASRRADFGMEMYNADGSRSEMCGNGIRCLARLGWERELAANNPLTIETDAGVKSVALELDSAGRVLGAIVDMGEPILEGREIPAAADGRIIDYPLEIAGRTEKITALSMGNPHCVIFVPDDSIFRMSDFDFASLGSQFEAHPFFPRRVNAEFVLPLTRDRLRMRVFERGSGETLACGTGACAALVAAALTGRASRRATVELRGGNLEVEWREAGEQANHVFMTGEAVEVFRGEIEVGADELVASAG
ncbi:MAG TPA: diaminopimelate epimerase [Candidatus Binataceae bacterium]|nr:diaminopimelate epimerase [Candidatus Binataceae bacterium]